MLCCRAQVACLQLVHLGPDGEEVSLQTSGWAIPKLWLMRKWSETIRAFDSANLTSTGFGEKTHVTMKDSFRFTNKHSSEAVDEQVTGYIYEKQLLTQGSCCMQQIVLTIVLMLVYMLVMRSAVTLSTHAKSAP